jgi:hypothetical protein
MEVSDQRHVPAALPRVEQNPGTLQIGSWVGHRPELEVLDKRKLSVLCRYSKIGLSSPNPSP